MVQVIIGFVFFLILMILISYLAAYDGLFNAQLKIQKSSPTLTIKIFKKNTDVSKFCILNLQISITFERFAL